MTDEIDQIIDFPERELGPKVQNIFNILEINGVLW